MVPEETNQINALTKTFVFNPIYDPSNSSKIHDVA